MPSAPSETVGVREFRARLSHYLKRVETGSHIAVVSRDRVVAELHPPQMPPDPLCTFGAMKGQIWMAPDWDDPDGELIGIMLNGPIFPDDDAA